ncbi:MAG TPA: hypothetical protein VHF05_00630 [Candidatus Paceibacterota bacterium]|nr:hypothetical protein [Candidatus Paceibacterota bacterium]
MLSLIHLTRVAEMAVVKRVLDDKRHLRDMDALVAFGKHAAILQKGGKVVERHVAGCVQLKNLAHEFRVFAMHSNRLRARVVHIAKRRKPRIYSLPRFLAQTASSIGGELAHILIRHPEFNRHHQNIVVGVVRAVVRLNMANHALLQKPLHLSTINGISCEAVNFPANNPLRVATRYSRHHIAEYGAAGHFRAPLFYKLLDDFQMFAPRERAQLCELRFNGQNLFVLYIGAFASV